MNHFFIACLPRSRSHWLSVLLTWGPVLCIHEPIRQGFGYPSPYHRYTGYCGSDLVMLGKKHDGPCVSIRRPMDEVQQSMRDAHFSDHAVANMPDAKAALEAWEMRNDAKVIDFADLDDEYAVAAMWQHLVPDGPPMPRDHYRRMQCMRIDLHQANYNASLRGFLKEPLFKETEQWA